MINSFKNLFCFVIVILSFTSLIAQNANIKYVDTSVKIDGFFDELIWTNLPEYTNFYNYLPSDIGLADNQTSVKLFHNGEYLFISATYFDTTEKTKVSTLKRDTSIFLSDSFVMVIDTQNQEQNGYFFAVNSLGNQTDGLIGRVNGSYDLSFSWNTVWQSKAILNGKKKQYEIAIPLKSLSFNNTNTTFGIQFYVRDIKNNSWTIFKNVKRNYANLDLRFTEKFTIDKLPQKSNSKFTITPSVTTSFAEDVFKRSKTTSFKPSLDVQYNLTSSLKLDVTVNPDFSQIDVDQQVTNLTRFAINFPERRNFFLENADLFSNLGVDGVNPFYSRRIGANSDIKFGIKLSGNLSSKTRIGVLNVQTKKEGNNLPQNYGTLVAEHQLTKNFTSTAFVVNRQTTNNFSFINNYNRVVGTNLNFKSTNNKWIGLINYAKSLNNDVDNKNNLYNLGVWYNKRGLEWNFSLKKVEENFLSDVGFTPRLYNFDAINNKIVREGYLQANTGFEYQKFYENSKNLNSVRYVNYNNNTYFNDDGSVNQVSHFLNSAVFFKDFSAVYYVLNYDEIDLKYGFDPLGNGNVINPGKYNFALLKVGYNSANNQDFRYNVNFQKGAYYNGNRISGGMYLNYQLLPFANIELSYNQDRINLHQLGKETFHLTRFTGELFFNNRLNWTTYLQYNNQRDNFNINTRLQWEYKPLSYVYLVVTDNFNKHLHRQNWGVAFKMNYRFDI